MRLFDTYSKSLVELDPGHIRMYFCGPTVYARAHVGNARPFIVGMWLRNWLNSRDEYTAELVHNITDVNDKIYDAAPGASAALAAQATSWYLEDVGDLGLGMPDHMPKVTEHIPQIVAFIDSLLESGHAYPVNGDVYFRVSSFSEYGRLSGNRLDQMEDLEPNPLKEDPRDFALWKASKPGEDTAWDTPWGRGRPGWHIECSAMAEDCFGESFEIHGGGLDLVFPHHENELAQSRALGHSFARIWAHNGLLRFTGEKMSKSVGNIATIREVLDEWGRETLLMFFLGGHWRKPIDFSSETMEQAKAQVGSFRSAFRSPKETPRFGAAKGWEHFVAALEDDFNTPEALAVMHAWRVHGFNDWLRDALQVFGLSSLADTQIVSVDVGSSVESAFVVKVEYEGEVPRRVIEAATEGEEARRNKDFETADLLRSQLYLRGWTVENTSTGPNLVFRRPEPTFMGAETPPQVKALAQAAYDAWQLFDDVLYQDMLRLLIEQGYELTIHPGGYATARTGRP